LSKWGWPPRRNSSDTTAKELQSGRQRWKKFSSTSGAKGISSTTTFEVNLLGNHLLTTSILFGNLLISTHRPVFCELLMPIPGQGINPPLLGLHYLKQRAGAPLLSRYLGRESSNHQCEYLTQGWATRWSHHPSDSRRRLVRSQFEVFIPKPYIPEVASDNLSLPMDLQTDADLHAQTLTSLSPLVTS
jgi:hypothetical protein